MIKFLKIFLFLLLAWCAWCGLKPYWNNLMLEMDINSVILYGRDNNLKDTKKFFKEVLDENNHDFSVGDFLIKKTKSDVLVIEITYDTDIVVFEKVIDTITFTIEKNPGK